MNPGDKVVEFVFVLDDVGDRVPFPFKVKGVEFNIIVRKSLYKMQHKDRRHTEEDKAEVSLEGRPMLLHWHKQTHATLTDTLGLFTQS